MGLQPYLRMFFWWFGVVFWFLFGVFFFFFCFWGVFFWELKHLFRFMLRKIRTAQGSPAYLRAN